MELFSAQEKILSALWKLSGSGIKKIFDETVKSHVFQSEGSTVTTKMQLPKEVKQSCKSFDCRTPLS